MGVTIERMKVYQVDLEPKTVRFDAKQSFVRQETPFVEITYSDGLTRRGYSYIISTGGGAVISRLADNLAPKLLGRDPAMVEKICRKRRRSGR